MAGYSTLQPQVRRSQQPVALLRFLGSFTFDAVFEEVHEATLEVTQNPVETGVVVSDHAFMKPLQLRLSAGVGHGTWQSPGHDAFASGTSRARKAFGLLMELQRQAEPVDVQTGLKLYSNMVVKTMRTVQDKDTAQVLVFTAELCEVIIVGTRSVRYPPGAVRQQAAPRKARGEQQGQEVTGDKKGSLLAKGLRNFGVGDAGQTLKKILRP